MPDINAPYYPQLRSDAIKAQIDQLESLERRTSANPSFDAFDADTQEILGRIYGKDHQYLEFYQYATLGEAEALVNLPESAQEPLTRDLTKTGLQQRRQVLESLLTELEGLESAESDLLEGEDREDPPGLS
ncbi:MAG: hypothetical protein KF814_12240 [Nitrospiraceae bacterium]|nr:hypothetical protein [Nitrospiraceae bacterium]